MIFGIEKVFGGREGENFKAPISKNEVGPKPSVKTEKVTDRVDLSGEKELVSELLADPKAVEFFVDSYLMAVTGNKDAKTRKLAQNAKVGLRLFLTSSINRPRFASLDSMGLMGVINSEFKKIKEKAMGEAASEVQTEIASQIEASMREQNFRALMKDAVKVARIKGAIDKPESSTAEQMKRAA